MCLSVAVNSKMTFSKDDHNGKLIRVRYQGKAIVVDFMSPFYRDACLALNDCSLKPESLYGNSGQ